MLVCPRTKQPLREVSREEAERIVAGGRRLHTRPSEHSTPFGARETVMVRADGKCAYPVVRGIAVLLAPEVLVSEEEKVRFDLTDPRYAEAYQEMAFYNAAAEGRATRIEESDLAEIVERVFHLTGEQRASFPEPWRSWLDQDLESVAQLEAYHHLAPLGRKRFLQLGGSGSHAVKFLLGGADEAWLVTPMHGEALFATALARRYGVEDRFRSVVGIGEELPFADGAFDGVYSGGCMHHMVTELALPECARVLRAGGRLSAVEPWKSPFYTLGTRIFGKKEPDVFCRPITHVRANPMFQSFGRAAVSRHGALTRYVLAALSRVGCKVKLVHAHRLIQWDDELTAVLPSLRGLGSVAALTATKGGALGMAAAGDLGGMGSP
jgi:uncharacterized protein YbaR (Trm112 family)/SAM-dependent methyltransferase